jgi:hypothetical protein
MYLQKVISSKNKIRNLFFVGIFKVNDEKQQNTDPGSGSGSISHRYGSADPDPDPDPHQNVMDPQHWFNPLCLYSTLILGERTDDQELYGDSVYYV